MMRPSSTKEDLLSTHNIKVYLCKMFVEHLEELAKEINVSPNCQSKLKHIFHHK
jgi:hypothetical protein